MRYDSSQNFIACISYSHPVLGIIIELLILCKTVSRTILLTDSSPQGPDCYVDNKSVLLL